MITIRYLTCAAAFLALVATLPNASAQHHYVRHILITPITLYTIPVVADTMSAVMAPRTEADTIATPEPGITTDITNRESTHAHQ